MRNKKNLNEAKVGQTQAFGPCAKKAWKHTQLAARRLYFFVLPRVWKSEQVLLEEGADATVQGLARDPVVEVGLDERDQRLPVPRPSAQTSMVTGTLEATFPQRSEAVSTDRLYTG